MAGSSALLVVKRLGKMKRKLLARRFNFEIGKQKRQRHESLGLLGGQAWDEEFAATVELRARAPGQNEAL